VDYKKLEALDKELGLGEWANIPAAVEMEHVTPKQALFPIGKKAPLKSKSKKPRNDFASIHRHVMDDIAAAYRINPMMMGNDRRPRPSSIHPMDEPYPVMILDRCTCNYAGCLTCNPPIPDTGRYSCY
jgi:hypothetical protein